MEYIIKNIKYYSKKELDIFYHNLSKIKKDKIDKYRKYESKIRSLIGEINLKELLLKYDIGYDNISYYINSNGKPYLKECNIFYNISHSFDYVITVVSRKEIGIDIEKIRKVRVNTINQFATKKEKEYILSSDSDVEDRIFKIYTLKEAYFKMLGTNMNNVFDIEFTIDNTTITCSDKKVNVGFIDGVKDYIIAYCEKK